MDRACPLNMSEARLPLSLKKVMKILDSGYAMPLKDPVKTTSLHPRTLRYARPKEPQTSYRETEDG